MTDKFSATDPTKFRALLKFGGLHQLMPAGATFNRALLNVTLQAWLPSTFSLTVRWIGGASGGPLCALQSCVPGRAHQKSAPPDEGQSAFAVAPHLKHLARCAP